MQIKFYKNLKRYVHFFYWISTENKTLYPTVASYQGLHCLLRIKREVHNKFDVKTFDPLALSLLAATFVLC